MRIALVPATVLALVGAGLEDRRSFAEAVRQYPHDGLNGLSALSDGLTAGFFIGLIAFLILFFAQRFLASSNSD
jgi:hypothetical protein